MIDHKPNGVPGSTPFEGTTIDRQNHSAGAAGPLTLFRAYEEERASLGSWIAALTDDELATAQRRVAAAQARWETERDAWIARIVASDADPEDLLMLVRELNKLIGTLAGREERARYLASDQYPCDVRAAREWKARQARARWAHERARRGEIDNTDSIDNTTRFA